MNAADRGFVEPAHDAGTTEDVLLAYLDYFRATVVEKVSGLAEEQLRTSVLPSGWSALELVVHLASMERRWLVWGFLGEKVPDPWADQDESGRWRVPDGATRDDLIDRLRAAGRRTRAIAEAHELGERGKRGGRFPDFEPAPTLKRILLHVLQEYARHTGHLDVVRELTDDATGE